MGEEKKNIIVIVSTYVLTSIFRWRGGGGMALNGGKY